MKKSFPLPVDLSDFAWYEHTSVEQEMNSLKNTFDINPYRAKPGKNANIGSFEPSGVSRDASQMAFGSFPSDKPSLSQKDLQLLLHARVQRLEKAMQKAQRKLDVPAGNARNMQRDAGVINRNARAPFQMNRTHGIFNTNRDRNQSPDERWNSIPEGIIGNLLSVPASFAHRDSTNNMYSFKRNPNISDEDFNNPDIEPSHKWKAKIDPSKVATELPLQLVSHLISGLVGGWGSQFDLLAGRTNPSKSAYNRETALWAAGKEDRRARQRRIEKDEREAAKNARKNNNSATAERALAVKMPELDAWGRLASGPFGVGTKAGGWRPIWNKDTNENTLVHTHDARWNDSNGAWEMGPRGTGKAESENVPLQDTHAEADIPWTAELSAKNDAHKLRLDHHAKEGNLFLDDGGFVSGKNPDYVEIPDSSPSRTRRRRSGDITPT